MEEEDIALVGFDADKEELKALSDGRLTADRPESIWHGLCDRHSSRKGSLKMGNEAVVDTGYTWVTKKNLKDENVAKMLY